MFYHCYEPKKTLRFGVRAAGYPWFYTEDPAEAEQKAKDRADDSAIVTVYDYDANGDIVAQWIHSSRVK